MSNSPGMKYQQMGGSVDYGAVKQRVTGEFTNYSKEDSDSDFNEFSETEGKASRLKLSAGDLSPSVMRGE